MQRDTLIPVEAGRHQWLTPVVANSPTLLLGVRKDLPRAVRRVSVGVSVAQLISGGSCSHVSRELRVRPGHTTCAHPCENESAPSKQIVRVRFPSSALDIWSPAQAFAAELGSDRFPGLLRVSCPLRARSLRMAYGIDLPGQARREFVIPVVSRCGADRGSGCGEVPRSSAPCATAG